MTMYLSLNTLNTTMTWLIVMETKKPTDFALEIQNFVQFLLKQQMKKEEKEKQL